MSEQYQPGDNIKWLHIPRGGYGYGWWIPGTVIAVKKRVKIEVMKKTGETVQKWVTPDRLKKNDSD